MSVTAREGSLGNKNTHENLANKKITHGTTSIVWGTHTHPVASSSSTSRRIGNYSGIHALAGLGKIWRNSRGTEVTSSLCLLLIREPFATGVTILRLILSYATTLFRFSGSSHEEFVFDRKLKMADNGIF